MNKQFIVSVLVLTILTMALGYVVHGILLESDYSALPNLMRTTEEAGQLSHFMMLAHLFIAVGLTWIYRMGIDPGKGWVGQGARFGFAVALVSVIPMFTIYYVVQQTPGILAIKQIAFETVSLVIIGIATAFLNRR